jgi:gluconolactonase
MSEAMGRILAEGLEFPEGPVALADGSLLLVEIKRQTITRISADGRAEVLARLPGGPNGLALGPGGDLFVCNNGGFLFREDNGVTRTRPGVHEGYAGGWIERLDRNGQNRVILYDRCGLHRLTGPNDLVFDAHGGFYFTDFGKTYPRSRDLGGLYYGLADGSRVVEVAFPLLTPNGVGLSPDGSVAYVAETETARLWAFDLEAPGVARRHGFPSSHGGRLVCTLPGLQRLDSLAVDAEGNVCVATLLSGCISVIDPGGTVLRQVPTGDPITTNICFGGADLQTAYVTLSGTGRVSVIDWPTPGLRLAHAA